jgi:hypothetical protein
VLAGCYDPTPPERVACSETAHCPQGQSCDRAYGECASVPLCLPVSISDTFDAVNAEPCAGWGTTFGTATVELRAGALALTPGASENGGCTTVAPFAFERGGAFVEVTKIGARTITAFSVDNGHAAIVVDGPELRFESSVATDVVRVRYRGDEMRWWRIRPSDDGYVGEYAPDGGAWVELGVVPFTVPGTIALEITVAAAGEEPGTSEVASFDVCPPDSLPP